MQAESLRKILCSEFSWQSFYKIQFGPIRDKEFGDLPFLQLSINNSVYSVIVLITLDKEFREVIKII
jgi:hypothetical protein